MPERGNIVGILLAFADEDGAVGIFQQFRPAVRYTTDAVEVPDPSALAIRLTLAKVLRFEPDDLVEQCSLVVGVVIRRVDLALRFIGGLCCRGPHECSINGVA
jgi:hypothetical protein